MLRKVVTFIIITPICIGIYGGVIILLQNAAMHFYPFESSWLGTAAVLLSHLGYGIILLPAFIIFTYIKTIKYINRNKRGEAGE